MIKRILFVGNSFSMIKKLSQSVEKVYTTALNPMMNEFCEYIDIRENDVTELLDFVLENDIDLTIAISKTAITSDITNIFQQNGQLIFAPTAKSAEFVVDKSFAKKFLYRMKINTPRFGIFDKAQVAITHLENVNYPVVVSNENGESICCTTVKNAKLTVEEMFFNGAEKIITEEYTYGHRFNLYAITDGYHVLPFATSFVSKFSENGDGGYLTSGMGCISPDFKIDREVLDEVFQNVVKIVDYLASQGDSYTGIISVEAVFDGENVKIIDFKPFFDKCETQAILNCVDENWIELFEACANGSFADEYDDILTNDNHSVSLLIKSRKDGVVIPNLDSIDCECEFLNVSKNKYFEYIVQKGDALILTAYAKTISRARQMLYDDVELIKFDGIKYRSDI